MDPEVIDSLLSKISSSIWYVAFALIIAFGIYATIRSKGIQFTRLGENFKFLISGTKEVENKKSISTFKAFWTSMGMRIGIGNIVGVATAIVMGGPGAVFWMWIFALICAATSFVENTVAQIYKEKKDDELYHGGLVYYIKNGLGKSKISIVIAFLLIILYGVTFMGININQVSNSMQDTFSYYFGNISFSICDSNISILTPMIATFLAIIMGVIIFGGIRRVTNVSAKIVPPMTILWLVLVLAIIITNITQFPAVFGTIFSYAFGLQAFVGGGIGAAIMWGMKRCIFSNESGVGNIPYVSSTSSVKHPIKQGILQSFGVFIDTIVVCSSTAFVIILYTNQAYPAYDFATQGIAENLAGSPIVIEAFSATFLGGFAPFIIALFLFIFAFSTCIGDYLLAETNLKFITDKKIPVILIRILVIAVVFCSSFWSMSAAWSLADISQAIMVLINIPVIFLLIKPVWIALSDYLHQKRNGIEEPVFDSSILPNEKGITCWHSEKKKQE